MIKKLDFNINDFEYTIQLYSDKLEIKCIEVFNCNMLTKIINDTDKYNLVGIYDILNQYINNTLDETIEVILLYLLFSSPKCSKEK